MADGNAQPGDGSQQPSTAVALSREDRLAYLKLLREDERRESRRKFYSYFPETGPLRRELYTQHMEFFRLGAQVRTRCFMAANRVGKTESGGGYETVCHLTGHYPPWWEGHRFNHHINAWVAGDTIETVRDIIQLKLVGPEGQYGTGLIPGDDLAHVQMRKGGGGAIDYVMVRHVSGGLSRLGFKSYDQKRHSFQGTEKHLIWLDEESEEGIRAECGMRLGTTKGLLIETFTPLRGLTPIVLNYLGVEADPDTPKGKDELPEFKIPESRVSISGRQAIVMAGWDDAPHLDAEAREEMLAKCEPHLVKCRSLGIPTLGAGAIYPIDEADIVVDDFKLPAHWPLAYGLDVGWNCTAAVFGAWDRESDIVYLYSLHYQGRQEPSTHVAGINARGDGIPGVIDPASRGRSQRDGEKLLEIYTELGLDISPADNSRESGLFAVHQRLATGRLKVFRSLRPWFAEYRIYRRDEKGQVVKVKDHAMDATRYLIVSGLDVAKVPIVRSDAAAFRRVRESQLPRGVLRRG